MSPVIRRLGMRHGLVVAAYGGVVTILMWPMFAAGSPPGVDTPTFLHLGWIVDQLLTGNLGSVFNDRYWYGGWPYAAAYPPLAYGAIGLLSAISPLPIEISYRAIVFLAYVGLALSVYGLALELGVRRSVAAWGGALSLFSYSMFVSLGIFGWFSTVVAVPLGVVGFTMIERSLRTGSRREAVVGGVLIAASLLAHHMTGFAFVIVMVPWAVYRLATLPDRRGAFRLLVYAGVGFLGVSSVWMLFFFPHLISVGFEREVAGNWRVDAEQVFRRALSREYLGREAYPSYLGLVQVPLGLAGVIYAVVTRGRSLGPAILLVAFTWISFGSGALPLIHFYPFSGLDVARFTVFMAPFAAVMAAVLVDGIVDELLVLGRRFRVQLRLVAGGLAAIGLLLLASPFVDGLKARVTLTPVQTIPAVDEVMEWIRTETPDDATVLAVGFRNWDDWWLPEQTGRAVMDGWNDEGAPNWREIREVRHMGWFGQVNSLRLYNIMANRNTDYLLIYHWQPIDSPHLFEAAAAQDPFLFRQRQAWPGLTMFERRDRS